MIIRAKFQVTSISVTQYGKDYYNTKIILEPRYDNNITEDASFSKATPNGKIEMQVDNPIAINELEIGKYFYVDFSSVPTPENKLIRDISNV